MRVAPDPEEKRGEFRLESSDRPPASAEIRFYQFTDEGQPGIRHFEARIAYHREGLEAARKQGVAKQLKFHTEKMREAITKMMEYYLDDKFVTNTDHRADECRGQVPESL